MARCSRWREPAGPGHAMDLILPRRVEPELLDGLAADDPRARRSRDDLRRLHRAMATLPIVQRALDRGTTESRPRTLLELGAGDGSLMLRLARRRAARLAGRSRHAAGPAGSGRARDAGRPAGGWLDAPRRGDGCLRLAGRIRRHALGCRLRQPVHASLFDRRARAAAAGNRRRAVGCSSAANPGAPPWRWREAAWSACWVPAP